MTTRCWLCALEVEQPQSDEENTVRVAFVFGLPSQITEAPRGVRLALSALRPPRLRVRVPGVPRLRRARRSALWRVPSLRPLLLELEAPRALVPGCRPPPKARGATTAPARSRRACARGPARDAWANRRRDVWAAT